MGFIDKVKGAIGSGGSSEEIAEDFEQELEVEEEIDQEFEEEVQEEEEKSYREWDSAYRFAEDMLQEDGHSDMMEFTKKVMFYEIDTSPLFRNRIEEGVSTINKITDAKESIMEIREGSGGKDYGEKAEELRQVNELMDQVDKLEGKEEQIVSEAMEIARTAATNLGKGVEKMGGDVDSSVSRNQEGIER